MCIIVAKPAGIPMPSYDIVEACWTRNPDGAGFMFHDGDRVVIRKGYMTLDGFIDAMNACISDPVRSAVVMHFRIATHGEVRPECCHPFPISADLERLRSRKSLDLVGVAHNGIIQGMKTDKLTSDTMAYISRVLAPLRSLCSDPKFELDKRAGSVIASTVGSKLAFLHDDGSIYTFGDFVEDNGIHYSNTTYKQPKWAYDYWKPYGSPRLDCLEFDACAECCLREECAEFGAYCRDEEEAAGMLEPIFGRKE